MKMIMIGGIEYEQTPEGYPYKIVKAPGENKPYNVFASLSQNIHYVLANSERVREKLEGLHALHGLQEGLDLGMASRIFDSDTAIRVFNPEVDTNMALALLKANEEEAMALLHENAAILLYKLFDKDLNLRLETQQALLNIKNTAGQTIFTSDDLAPSGILHPALINAVYASIAFGFSYVFEQANEKKREALPEASYIHEQLLQYAGQDKLILERVKALVDNEISMLRHDHLTAMTKQAGEILLQATNKIEAATNCQTILAIYEELDAIKFSEKTEIDKKIKMVLTISKEECLGFMERDPLKKITTFVAQKINPRLAQSAFNDFSVELKTRLAKKEEEDIRYIKQFDQESLALNTKTKMLRDEYRRYELPTMTSSNKGASRELFSNACFRKMRTVQEEVLAGLANPETQQEVKKALPAKRRELANYLIMAEAAMSMTADHLVGHAVTEHFALNRGNEIELTVETRLDTMLVSSDIKSEDCRELLSLRAEKLHAEITGLYDRVNERHIEIKQILHKVPDKIAQESKLFDLQAAMTLTVETLDQFSVVARETGIIQDGYDGLKQVESLQALRDTANSFYQKFWYGFEETKVLLNQAMSSPMTVEEDSHFQVLNSAMGDFLDSTREANAITKTFNQHKQDEKIDRLIDAIRQTALARLQVKRLFRTGEVLKLYQRAASISEPHLDSVNLNNFIKEITRFQKWATWGIGGVMVAVKTDTGEEKYRLPHGIALMWQTIQAFGVVYNRHEKCFELPGADKEKESEGEGRAEGGHVTRGR